jgi:hypothetical protein
MAFDVEILSICMDIAPGDYAENPVKNPYIFSFPARPARPAAIVISGRHLSLRLKVWQRTVARGVRG